MRKFITAAGVAITGMGYALLAGAQTFVVPTSTASNATANVGTQLSDPGTLSMIAVAIAIPLFFYVVHQLIGLLPKGRARRS